MDTVVFILYLVMCALYLNIHVFSHVTAGLKSCLHINNHSSSTFCMGFLLSSHVCVNQQNVLLCWLFGKLFCWLLCFDCLPLLNIWELYWVHFHFYFNCRYPCTVNAVLYFCAFTIKLAVCFYSCAKHLG